MPQSSTMKEIKESMVSLTNHHQESILRTAHFLTPSIKAPVQAPLQYPLTNAAKKYKDSTFKVNLRGWRHSTNKWEKWVEKMQSLHHLTWKKAGIFDAIMSSTSVIHRNTSLIYGFVEKWCPVTNSFVFPWGEATVTLEDMVVLGGYSVLGDSVLISTPKESEIEKTVEKLVMVCFELTKSRSNRADQSVWMNRFMDSGSEIEHEAFLAFWLCRFVFPMKIIGASVLSIAVHLSRGIKIALAPAVLGGIYQSLSLLKAAMVTAREIGNGGKRHGVLEVTVSAPLALVQVWVWERFPNLQPKANTIGPSEQRIARWHNLKQAEIKDLSLRINSASGNFEWRPYVKAMKSSFRRKIYVDNEYLATVETELDEELEGWIRCIRTSELVGLEADCIEQYLPHRVAMQFGMDQDLPGCVARVNASREIAWSDYNRPIRDKSVYVPSCLSKPGVTTRYLKWWKKLNCGVNGTVEDAVDGKGGSSENSKIEVIEDEDLVPFSLNGTEADSHGKCSFMSPQVIFVESDSSEGVSPPDFPLKRKRGTAEDSGYSGISKPLTYERNSNSVPRQVARQTSSSTPNGTKSVTHENDYFKGSKTISVESSSPIKRAAELSTRESCGNKESQDGDVQGRLHSSSEVTSLPKTAESEVMKTLEKEGKEQWTEAGLRLDERIRVIEKLCDLLKIGKLSFVSLRN